MFDEEEDLKEVIEESGREEQYQDLLGQTLKIKDKQKRTKRTSELYRRILKGEEVNTTGFPEWHSDYINERDSHLGDFVIVFPNPDQQINRQYMKLNDCLNILENGFKFQTDEQGQIFKERFTDAFLFVYNQLERVRLEDKEYKAYSKTTDQELVQLNNQVVDKYKNLQLKPLVRRKVQAGRYLEKTNNQWHKIIDRQKQEQGDFMSLVRNAIFLKLGEQIGFQQRTFIYEKSIICVLFGNNENLERQAESTERKKEVALCSVDILSYEPVDKRLRPLRLHSLCPHKCKHYLSKIDYKRIGREIGQGLPENKQETVKEQDKVSSETWKTYQDYLSLLYARVVGIRLAFSQAISQEEEDKAFQVLEAIKTNNNKQKENRHIPVTQRHTKVI